MTEDNNSEEDRGEGDSGNNNHVIVHKKGMGEWEYWGYIKAMFNAMGFICIALGTMYLFSNVPGLPLLKFIPFIVLAIAMATYPTSSASSEEEIGLAMMRSVIGILLVAIFGFFTFGDLLWGSAFLSSEFLLWLSLFAIAAGFFISIPVIDVSGVGGRGAYIMKEIQSTFKEVGKNMNKGILEAKKDAFGGILKLFLIVVLIIVVVTIGGEVIFSLLSYLGIESLVGYELGGVSTTVTPFIGLALAFFAFIGGCQLRGKMESVNPVLLGVFGGIGLFAGSLALNNNVISFIVFSIVVGFGILAALPVDKVRPAIGIPILLIALTTTTMAYPDVMGEATFGVWWPTIDYSLETTLGPILENIRSPMDTLSSGYGCLTNPVQCYQDYQPQTSTKESTRSVEVTTLTVIGNDQLDKAEEFTVITTIENQGKETAKGITITPQHPHYTHGTDEGTDAGDVSIICQDSDDDGSDSCYIDKLLPGEIREYIIEYDVTNFLGGNYVSYGANITYDTTVSGQVDVMVMDNEYYYKLSKNGELSLSEQITEDTGGPVRLGLALMRNQMPIRDNLRGVPIMLYLNNEGPGEIENVKSAEIDISDLYPGESVSCSMTEDPDSDFYLDISEEYFEHASDSVISGEDIKSKCKGVVPDITAEQKTFAITGEVVYEYKHSRLNKIGTTMAEDDMSGEAVDSEPIADGCHDLDSGDFSLSCQEWCANHGSECGGRNCNGNDREWNNDQTGGMQNPNCELTGTGNCDSTSQPEDYCTSPYVRCSCQASD